VPRLPDPPRPTRGSVDLVKRLGKLRDDLEKLGAAVSSGKVAPNAIAQTLASAVDDVHQLFADLARQPDAGQSVRRSAASFLLDALTPRERQVADAVLNHGTTAIAAHALGMSEATLGHHRSNILHKLRATSFTQIARMLAEGS
jgi:DNA-binding CsgD family transcriptional regulator